MKKFILLGVVVAGFSLTSCKKTYTCSCETGGSTVSQDYTVNKDDAETLKASCETSTYCTWSVK